MITDWQLQKFYKSINDKQITSDFEIVKKENQKFIDKWKNRNDYLENPKILHKALTEYEDLEANYGIAGKPGYYLELKSYLDLDNTIIKAKINSMHREIIKILNSLEFFELRLSKVDSATQKKLLDSPILKPYKHFLHKLFEHSKHLLSEKEEKILNIKSKTSHSNWIAMVSRFLSKEERKIIDEDGKKRTKSFSEILPLMNSQKQKVRDSAAQAFHEINAQYAEVAENEMNSILEDKRNTDELRKFEYPEQARHLADDIDTNIVDTMIKAVTDNFNIAKDYYKLKAKLFGKKKLKYHERNVPYGKSEKKYSFKDAVELISKVLTNLDPEFHDIFNEILENGQIDVYPTKSKSPGACCIHDIKKFPTFILINYAKKINDVKTLAHETGHAINNELMREKQNALNFGSPLSIAEVASTFFEDFVLEELMKKAGEEERKIIMLEKINDDVSSIFRQVAAYNFEKELHSKFRETGYLAKDEIGDIFRKHMASYMGDFVSQDPGSENWWVYWSHFRRFFYVYSYASGLLISKALQAKVRENPANIQVVKEVLSAGSSASPKHIFKSAGIDIESRDFWISGVNEVGKSLSNAKSFLQSEI